MPLQTHSISLSPLTTPRLTLTPVIVGPPSTQLSHGAPSQTFPRAGSRKPVIKEDSQTVDAGASGRHGRSLSVTVPRANSIPNDTSMKRERSATSEGFITTSNPSALSTPFSRMSAWMFKFLAAHPDMLPEVETILYPRPAAPRQRTPHSRKLSWPWLFLSTTPMQPPPSPSPSPIEEQKGDTSPMGNPPDFVHVPSGSRCIWIVELRGATSTSTSTPPSPAGLKSAPIRASSPMFPLTLDAHFTNTDETEAPPQTFIGIIELRPPAPPVNTSLAPLSPISQESPNFLTAEESQQNLHASPTAFPEFDQPHITAVMDPIHCGNGYSKEALKAVLGHIFRAPSHPDSAVTVSPSSSPHTPSMKSPSTSVHRPLFFFATGMDATAPGRIGIGSISSWSRDTGIASLGFTPPSRLCSSVAIEICDVDAFDVDDFEPSPSPASVSGATGEKVLEGLGFVPVKKIACGAAGRFVRRRGYGAVLVRRDWMCWEMEREEFLDLWVG
ncbi:hypothetical protein HDU97_002639 [Phlyctochytrium planicorne]|nr:hypothetical protein HDU97_002639 [Phlyctochytrium planicorne]